MDDGAQGATPAEWRDPREPREQRADVQSTAREANEALRAQSGARTRLRKRNGVVAASKQANRATDAKECHGR